MNNRFNPGKEKKTIKKFQRQNFEFGLTSEGQKFVHRRRRNKQEYFEEK